MLKLYVYPVQEICPDALHAPLHLLTDARRKKIQEMKNPAEKCRGIAAGLLLRKALQAENVLYADESFCRGAHGKPQLKSNALYFNLSHAGALVVCAVADIPVGIDVESLSRFADDARNQRLAARILHEEELKKWSGDKEKLLFFWTRKESYVKMTGDGLSREFQKINTLRNGFFWERSVKWQSDVYRISVCTSADCGNVTCDFSQKMIDY